jgi:hypothetical protein
MDSRDVGGGGPWHVRRSEMEAGQTSRSTATAASGRLTGLAQPRARAARWGGGRGPGDRSSGGHGRERPAGGADQAEARGAAAREGVQPMSMPWRRRLATGRRPRVARRCGGRRGWLHGNGRVAEGGGLRRRLSKNERESAPRRGGPSNRCGQQKEMLTRDGLTRRRRHVHRSEKEGLFYA